MLVAIDNEHELLLVEIRRPLLKTAQWSLAEQTSVPGPLRPNRTPRLCLSVLRPPPRYPVPLPRFAGEDFLESSRHSRVGSSSGSGVSCGGRSGSGTLRRFTRMRVQI